MKQFRVELRTGINTSKLMDVVANSHEQARMRVERQTGLLVLSTELIC